MDRQKIEQIDGWTDSWIDRQINGQIDEQIDRGKCLGYIYMVLLKD